MGEQQNCLTRHNVDSCLLPIRDAGVHTIQDGSRKALGEFLYFLETHPRDLSTRWLLNIAYMTLGEYPDGVPSRWLVAPEVFDSDYDIGRFYDVSTKLGLDTIGLAGGSVMEDIDGDGFPPP